MAPGTPHLLGKEQGACCAQRQGTDGGLFGALRTGWLSPDELSLQPACAWTGITEAEAAAGVPRCARPSCRGPAAGGSGEPGCERDEEELQGAGRGPRSPVTQV